MAVTLHGYTPTEYKNAPDHKTTPLNATNLNHSEVGIDDAHTDIAAVYSEMQTEDAKRVKKSEFVSISITGNKNNTGATIPAGRFFYLNGNLVRAKVNISNNGTLTNGTNYYIVEGGGLNDAYPKFATSNTSTASQLAPGNYVTTNVTVPSAVSGKIIDAIIPICASPQAHTTSIGVIASLDTSTGAVGILCVGSGVAQKFTIMTLFIYH